MSATYGVSPIKRRRRTKEDMLELLTAAQSEINSIGQMTIRHLFYRLSGKGVIEKTQTAYHNLCGHLSKWRKAGAIPFSAFVDSTRMYYGNTGYDELKDALIDCAETYRKNYWRNSPYHLEVWSEKETIASLLTNACREFGVQVFPCRGFASLSSLDSCAALWGEHIQQGKEVHVLYFGDHDPSGVRIDQTAQETLKEHFKVEACFHRIAVTRDQILEYNLPTRPTKRNSSHSKGFEGDSVDIDAFDPGTLRTLVRDSVETYMNQRELAILKATERDEREYLARMAGGGL